MTHWSSTLHLHVLLLNALNAVENKQNASVREIIYKIRHFIICLTYLSSCVNPIVYMFMCDEYKNKNVISLDLFIWMIWGLRKDNCCPMSNFSSQEIPPRPSPDI